MSDRDDYVRALLGTKQEQNLYKHHLNNLMTGGAYLSGPQGPVSTVRGMSVGIGGKTYMLPRIWGNRELSEDDAIARAEKQGLQTFPSYPSPEAAESRYNTLHDFMEQDVR